MWILYLIGIVLLIMFAKSMILNPILFKKKWQAVLGYGVPGIICLLLFICSYSYSNIFAIKSLPK